jgi:hypothetical protein
VKHLKWKRKKMQFGKSKKSHESLDKDDDYQVLSYCKTLSGTFTEHTFTIEGILGMRQKKEVTGMDAGLGTCIFTFGPLLLVGHAIIKQVSVEGA